MRAVIGPAISMTRIYACVCVGFACVALLLNVTSAAAEDFGAAAVGESLSCIVDVGESGACLYGNWLSGEVELRFEGCNVFLGGILLYPTFTGVGEAAMDSVCADFRVKRARKRYEYFQDVFANGRLYLIAPGVTQNIAVNTRASQQFLDELNEAKSRCEPITGENWDATNVLMSSVAELIRNPIPIERCGGF